MNGITKTIGLCLALLALGFTGTATAGTGSTTITGDISGNTARCQMDLGTAGWTPTVTGDPLHPGWKNDLSVTGVGACDFTNVSGTGTMYKDADGFAELEMSASASINIGFIVIACSYGLEASGTWDFMDPPTNSIKYFGLDGLMTRTGGSMLCPSPVNLVPFPAWLSNP